jgi:hypothetical protein
MEPQDALSGQLNRDPDGTVADEDQVASTASSSTATPSAKIRAADVSIHARDD